MSRVMYTQSIPPSENRNLKVILTSRTFLIVFCCLFFIWKEESWQINSLHCSQSSWEGTVGSTPSEWEVSYLLRTSLITFRLWLHVSGELFANRSGPQAVREYFICLEFTYGPQSFIEWVSMWKSCVSWWIAAAQPETAVFPRAC